LRYERKYRITNLNYEELVSVLGLQAYNFQIQFPDRQVNSIYYDDASFSNVQANLSGVSKRSKFRIRWYGSELKNIHKPILEKKIKENQLGFKEQVKLEDFELESELFKISQIDSLHDLELYPVVSVHYHRSYFLSFHKKIRATIDRCIQFRQIENYTLSSLVTEDNAIILEIKYDETDGHIADEVLNSIPFRITKNSKYVSAVESSWF